jgi:hypothetical protein
MLILETVVRIRREHAEDKSIKAIARDLRLSRKVVRKAIRAPEAEFTYRRSVQSLPRIGPFQERLDTLLSENEARPRRERLRITRIHDLLLRDGFEGSYDAVRRYASRWQIERRRDAGVDLLHPALDGLGREVAVARVHRAHAAAVHRHRAAGDQAEVAAEQDEAPAASLDGGTVIATEVGDGPFDRLRTGLKSGASLPVSHINSTLRPASRSSRRLDCTWLR